MPRRREVPKRVILPDPLYHNEEVAKFMDESRVLQIERVRKAYSERDIDPDAIPPEAVVFLISAISMLMVREAQTGVSITHKEVHDMVERFLRQFD